MVESFQNPYYNKDMKNYWEDSEGDSKNDEDGWNCITGIIVMFNCEDYIILLSKSPLVGKRYEKD